jgi:SAM-dependent methyltransferase
LQPAEYDMLASVERRHWWWRARREILAGAIARFAPRRAGGKPLRLAEVGCGSGGNLPALAAFGEVIGGEPSPLALAHLRRAFGDRFTVLQHRIPEPLADGLDVLCMLDVLEHLKDDAEALRWAATQLAPDGIALITVPAFGFLWTAQDEAVHHFRRYSPAQLARLVPPELETVYLGCFNTALFLPILAVRTAMRWVRDRRRTPTSHLGVPAAPINWILYQIFRRERHLLPRWRLPIGVSVLLVARRRPR